MAKHDESKVLRSVSKIADVDYSNHFISLSRNKIPGIKMWGKLDFLSHYCGWRIFWNSNLVVSNKNYTDDDKSTITKEKILSKRQHNLYRQ